MRAGDCGGRNGPARPGICTNAFACAHLVPRGLLLARAQLTRSREWNWTACCLKCNKKFRRGHALRESTFE
jgi:hypothetical protein